MADALQWHIDELVDGIVFKDSELPDDLLADGCLTEDECAIVRVNKDRRDQVRILLSIIKGRDFDVLKRFLKHVRAHNEHVANSIKDKFEQNKRCSKCALCKLISQVNLKYIVDILWKYKLINDGLFNLIVETNKPTGAQNDLWSEIIHSLNIACAHSTSDVRNIVEKALTKKHHYHHLAKGVQWMINTNSRLTCWCDLQQTIRPAESFISMVSSRSPQTSASESAAGSQSDVSRISSQTEIANLKETARARTHHTTKPREEKAPSAVKRTQDGFYTVTFQDNRNNMTISSLGLRSENETTTIIDKSKKPTRKTVYIDRIVLLLNRLEASDV